MFWRVSRRAAPVLFLVLSALWTSGVYFPFFYSLSIPNHEIQNLVGALEGHQSARQELSSLVQNTVDSFGHLKRAIRVAAYYGASAEYKMNQSHTSKKTEYAYLAWFEKRSRPTVLVVNLSEIDGSVLRFNIHESEPLALAQTLILPLIVLSFAFYWFRRNRASGHKESIPEPVHSTTRASADQRNPNVRLRDANQALEGIPELECCPFHSDTQVSEGCNRNDVS